LGGQTAGKKTVKRAANKAHRRKRSQKAEAVPEVTSCGGKAEKKKIPAGRGGASK